MRFARAGLPAFLLCVAILAPLSAAAGEFEALLAQAAAAEAAGERDAALEHLQAAHALQPNDAALNHRIAQHLFDSSLLASDDEREQQLVEEALPYARRSLELEPENALHVLSLAVLEGRLSLWGSVSDKVAAARRIRRQAERALELEPDFAAAHLVLGRWHVEVYRIGFARRMATLFFGGLPKASLKSGIAHLQRAIELEPGVVAHRVELGYAYAARGDIADALELWRAALELPADGIYDRAAKNRARRGIRRYSPPVKD